MLTNKFFYYEISIIHKSVIYIKCRIIIIYMFGWLGNTVRVEAPSFIGGCVGSPAVWRSSDGARRWEEVDVGVTHE